VSKVLQEWECLVRELTPEAAWLGLIDVTAGSDQETEMAEVPLSGFPADVIAAMQEGTILTWKIEQDDDGKTSSNFALYPTGVWTQEDIDRAKAEAHELWLKLNWK
jgi:hypothetical protein